MRRAILMNVKYVYESCRLLSLSLLFFYSCCASACLILFIHSHCLSDWAPAVIMNITKYYGFSTVVSTSHQIIRRIYCQSSFLCFSLCLASHRHNERNNDIVCSFVWLCVCVKTKCAHILFTFQWLCVIAHDTQRHAYLFFRPIRSITVTPPTRTLTLPLPSVYLIRITLTLHANILELNAFEIIQPPLYEMEWNAAGSSSTMVAFDWQLALGRGYFLSTHMYLCIS